MTLLRTALGVGFALAASACTPYDDIDKAPVAVAGNDRMLNGSGVELTLDGSKSQDPDGKIVEYEWHYTGDPTGFDLPADPDASAIDDPLTDLLAPLPEFCAPPDPEAEAMIPARYCLLEPDRGKPSKATVTLEPGGYRFTLWVTDDDGKSSADTVEVLVGP